MVRRHHPFVGRSLAVVREGRQQLIVRLPDGSTTRLPRSWTDADGEPPPAGSGREMVCTVGGLHELTDLIEALRARARS